MDTYTVDLRDADDLEEFYVTTTGMKPDYLQLSAGVGGMNMTVVELDGMSLVWGRFRGKGRWRDEISGGIVHLGYAVQSSGPIRVRGREVGPEEAMVYIPGKEMEYVLDGPGLTLEVSIGAPLADELGWEVRGDELRSVSQSALDRLTSECSRATQLATQDHAGGAASIRQRILDEMENVIEPWLVDDGTGVRERLSDRRRYELIRRADAYMEGIGFDARMDIGELLQALSVPRRTLFHAFRKSLGVGPRRYFELKRLRELRSRLRRHSIEEATVTGLATALGFSDMGRLAATYRQHYGENPSNTLRA